MSEANAIDRPVRHYPLEIENVGDDTYILMSRGHHDPHEFMRAVRAEGYEWPLGMPEHKWLRAVPTNKLFLWCIYVFAEPYSRGAFPATYVHEAWGEDSYEAKAPNTQSGDTAETHERGQQ